MVTLIIKDAWVCDDAYITFRVVDHFWLGHGLEWNLGERVQVATHPLWLASLILAQPLVGEPFTSSLLLGTTASIAAIWRLSQHFYSSSIGAAASLIIIGSSKAMMDFSTSGLETSLTCLLLVLCAEAWRDERDHHLSILTGLVMLTRLDAGLMLVPLWLHRIIATRGQATRHGALSLLAPMLWAVGSLVYFGEPLPNTALAKLGQSIPISDRLGAGAQYIENSLNWDPVTLFVIITSWLATLGTLRWSSRTAPLALASAAGVTYAIWIGGDFMSGRFLTVPFFCAVLAMAELPSRFHIRSILLVAAAIVCLGLAASHPRSPLRTGLDYADVSWDETGIADERGFYFQAQGLLPMLLDGRRPERPGRPHTHQHDDTVLVDRTVGINGYTAGPHAHLIDRYALTDAFLARLPVRYAAGWRPGHWDRPIPAGYRATLRSGRLQISDPDISDCYERVRAVHTGPLFTPERLQAMWALNTRGCSDLWRDRWMHPQTTEWQTD